MEQPELGKKIAELRLAKGMTQQELADLSNIGLRTIQRIESAVVTPRPYTLKVIFEHLDYDGLPSKETNKGNQQLVDSGSIPHLSQQYTVNRFLIISLPILAIVVLLSMTGSKEDPVHGPSSIAEFNKKYVDWFNNGQIDSIGLAYLEDACLVPYNHKEIHGRRNIQRYLQDLYSDGFRLYKSNITAIVANDSITVERGTWSGNSSGNMTGTYLAQWRLVGDKWYIENSMSNGDYNY